MSELDTSTALAKQIIRELPLTVTHKSTWTHTDGTRSFAAFSIAVCTSAGWICADDDVDFFRTPGNLDLGDGHLSVPDELIRDEDLKVFLVGYQANLPCPLCHTPVSTFPDCLCRWHSAREQWHHSFGIEMSPPLGPTPDFHPLLTIASEWPTRTCILSRYGHPRTTFASDLLTAAQECINAVKVDDAMTVHQYPHQNRRQLAMTVARAFTTSTTRPGPKGWTRDLAPTLGNSAPQHRQALGDLIEAWANAPAPRRF